MPPWLITGRAARSASRDLSALTSADLEKAAVHEARAALAGREECVCRLCKRVAAELQTEEPSR